MPVEPTGITTLATASKNEGVIDYYGKWRYGTTIISEVIYWDRPQGGHVFYVGTIGDYNVTYGAFAALIILLLWTWIAGLAFLFGAELDAELGARGPVRAGAAAGGSVLARWARRRRHPPPPRP